MKRTVWIVALVFVLLLSACTSSQELARQTESATTPPPTSTAPPPATATPSASTLAPSSNTAQVWLHSPLGVAFGPTAMEGARGQIEGFVDYIHGLGVPRTKVSFYWSQLEPQPGRYDFRDLDAYLDQLGPDDRALLNLFTDGWCTTGKEVNSRKGAPLRACPEGEADCTKSCEAYYREFVTRVAEEVRDHAHGGIRYMQRDTEPASAHHFPADSPQAFVELQHIFYQAVKNVLPDVLVIGVNHNGNFSAHDMGKPLSADFFDYVLQHGKDDFDLLDIRLYGDLYAIPHRVEWFRKRMAQYGYQKPIVSTEYGGVDPRTLHDGRAYLFMDQLRQIEAQSQNRNGGEPQGGIRAWARAHPDQVPPKLRPFFGAETDEERLQYEHLHCYDIVQRSIVALGEGVQALWWWNLQSPGVDPIFGQMRLRTPQMEELPGYACYRRFAGHMGNATKVTRVDTGDDTLYLYRIEREDRPDLFIAWHHTDRLDIYDDAAEPPVSVSLPIPFDQATLTDALGNPVQGSLTDGRLTLALSAAPVFIEPAP